MEAFDPVLLRKLYTPPPDSHKGQNGKLLLIGGSHLFHSASLWALKIASRIVDMVFYASVPENNEIVRKAKEEFRDGIVIPRSELHAYISEADVVLIGPGMTRTESGIKSQELRKMSLDEINQLRDEGEQTRFLTQYLLEKYPKKRFVIDAGALQVMETSWLKTLHEMPILTPHAREFSTLFGEEASPDSIAEKAKEYNAVILVKGEKDTLCSPEKCVRISGGNAGMTKGGTGDVLAGFIAALACKNEPFLAASAGSYINKKAGDALYERVGPYFNASDLADEIPRVMKELVIG